MILAGGAWSPNTTQSYEVRISLKGLGGINASVVGFEWSWRMEDSKELTTTLSKKQVFGLEPIQKP